MKRIFVILIIITALFTTACKHANNKKSMKGDEKVELKDFVVFFDDIKLPVAFKDSILAKKPNDSSTISQQVFNQFITDTIFNKDFGKDAPAIYAVGKFRNGKKETYLLIWAIHNKKRKLYAAVMNEKDSFKTMAPMLSLNGSPGKENLSIDSKFTFTNSNDTKGADGTIYTVNKVIAYNNAGVFMVILTDGLPAGVEMPIIDPIDTLPKKGKFAGNYAKNKRNFISVRDGSKPQSVKFFIHIEKELPQHATGEFKGEAIMVSADSAVYKADGDPCGLSIKFEKGHVEIIESNCGNRHDMETSFDGNYTKQKEAVKTVVKIKKK